MSEDWLDSLSNPSDSGISDLSLTGQDSNLGEVDQHLSQFEESTPFHSQEGLNASTAWENSTPNFESNHAEVSAWHNYPTMLHSDPHYSSSVSFDSDSNRINSLEEQNVSSQSQEMALDTPSSLDNSDVFTSHTEVADLGNNHHSSLEPSEITFGCEQKISVSENYWSDSEYIRVNGYEQIYVEGRQFYTPIPGNRHELGHMGIDGTIYDAHGHKIGHANNGCAWDIAGNKVASGWGSDRIAAAVLVEKRIS